VSTTAAVTSGACRSGIRSRPSAITADLDLKIDPVRILDLAGLYDPPEIAGVVDPSRRVPGDTDEIGGECAVDLVVATKVAGGRADPRDADLAGPTVGEIGVPRASGCPGSGPRSYHRAW
jgi:hypothetical protein